LAFRVDIVPSALKGLQRAEPRDIRHRLAVAIDRLAPEPMPVGSLALEGGHGLRRLRVGDCRIVYRIDASARRVTVVLVADRKEVYRSLRRLTRR
jgi:mRNA interferase RelE/StbE